MKSNIHDCYATQQDTDGQTGATVWYMKVSEIRLGGCPPTTVYFSWVAVSEDRHVFCVTSRIGMGILDEAK